MDNIFNSIPILWRLKHMCNLSLLLALSAGVARCPNPLPRSHTDREGQEKGHVTRVQHFNRLSPTLTLINYAITFGRSLYFKYSICIKDF